MKRSPSPEFPVLRTISKERFLSKYWQRKPLLIKKGLVPFPDIIQPEELAGMACDERVESRLIMEKGGSVPWELKRGPFKPSLFKKLPKTHWTLLVNGVDRFIPSVHQLLEEFSFLPFWRMDDIMISYAADQGNVGAHVDNFDVFLIQAAGRRKWMIEDRPVMEDNFVPGLPVRLLKKFKPSHTWVLEPGDILYLPPRFPHHGVAQGDGCMTISVGFRAPTHADIVNGVTLTVLGMMDDKVRDTDPGLTSRHPGEISAETVARMQKVVAEAMAKEGAAADWFGRFVTEPYGDVKFEEPSKRFTRASLSRVLKSEGSIVRAEGARLAFIAKRGREIALFINGERRELKGAAADLGKVVSGKIVIPSSSLRALCADSAAANLLVDLLNSGELLVEEGS